MEENKNIEPEQQLQNIAEEINSTTENILPEAETAATEEPQTSNLKTETSNMEVHHHGHVHEKKKWKEYVFQFIMLFLAVFCGFLAEYQLEHIIEKQREKQYMQSLIEDLKADTTNLTRLIQLRYERHAMYDSLTNAFIEKTFSNNGSSVYYWGRSITRRDYFFSSDGTMQQLKNSGGLRLISKKSIADQLMAYDVLYRTVQNQQQLEETQLEEYRNLASKAFDGAWFKKLAVFKDGKDSKRIFISERLPGNPQLKDSSPTLLNEVVNKLNYWRAGSNFISHLLNQMREKASLLIASIENEYHMK